MAEFTRWQPQPDPFKCAHFATLYAKPAGRPFVDTVVKEFKQNKWIFFPWDIDYQFVKPIKDGGKARTV